MSAVVPALNEAANLSFVLPHLGRYVDEIVLVDGRSGDGTAMVARALVPEARIVEQTGTGKGDAVRCGLAAARGDVVVMLDADGSTDPREIPAFVGALVAGADLAKGTRFAQGAGTEDLSLLRRFGNRMLVSVVRLLFGGRFSDLCYGYIALWRRYLPVLDLDADGFEIETEISVRALRNGLRIVEVPSVERRRIHGKSNLRAVPDGWRVLRTIVRERVRTSVPSPDGIAKRRPAVSARYSLTGRRPSTNAESSSVPARTAPAARYSSRLLATSRFDQ